MVEAIHPFLPQVFRSELKLKILLSLLRGSKELSALNDELESSGSTIIHALQDLEEVKLTHKIDKTYQLTSPGKIFALLLRETNLATKVLTDHQDFWLRHDVEAIPDNLLKRLGDLENSLLVQDTGIDLAKVHTTFQEILLTSMNLRGVSPIFHPDYIEAFQQLLKNGASVELILTREVLERTLENADQDQFLRHVLEGRLKIYLHDDLKVALTVTENSFSLGLFTVEGAYDYGMDLVSNSLKAINWGKELFEIYLSQAETLDWRQLPLETT